MTRTRTLLCATLLLAGCSGKLAPATKTAAADPPKTPAKAFDAPGPGERDERLPLSGTLNIWAHESLDYVLPQMAQVYQQRNPDVVLNLVFGTDAQFANSQAELGKSDIFIFDSEQAAITAHPGADGYVIAANQLVLVTNATTPTLIGVVEDLQKVTAIGIASDEEHAGTFARQFLTDSKLLEPLEAKLKEYPSSKLVLDAVARGEVPLGFAYVTEARGTPGIQVTLACGLDVPPTYAAVTPTGTELARDFIGFLIRPLPQTTFKKAGFASVAPYPLKS